MDNWGRIVWNQTDWWEQGIVEADEEYWRWYDAQDSYSDLPLSPEDRERLIEIDAELADGYDFFARRRK